MRGGGDVSEEFIVEFVVIFVLSIIANVIIDRFRNWNKKRKERRRLENTPIEDPRPFRISGSSTIAPPLPVRNTQSSERTPQTSNTSSPAQVVASGAGTPPALPHRQTRVNTNIEDYPRCPIHKCCNRRGESQKIFYDNGRRMWRCYRGHNFSS